MVKDMSDEDRDTYDHAPSAFWRGLVTAIMLITIVALVVVAAAMLLPHAGRAGDYGEYSGQSWAERAMNEGFRVRGKPQYQPYQNDSYSYGYRDRYSAGNHRITPRVAPHSHPHHRERGYSRVTHTHPVVVYKTHTHHYRPRYTHPRYVRHYYHWRPHYHRPHWTRWQEYAAPRYAWVKVPLYSRDGHRVPERYRWDPDIRAAWERGYASGRRDDRGYGDDLHYYRSWDRDWSELDRLARRGYMEQDRIPSKAIDCKPPVKIWGESRLTHANAQK